MKENEFGKQSNIKGVADDRPLCLRVRKGLKEELKAIPNWQDQVREFLDLLVEINT